MTPAAELEIARTKIRALKLYEAWKIEQLLPLAQKWASEGCTPAEFDRRLEALKTDAEEEMKLVLRAVTIFGLKGGMFDAS